jgi:aryl-alcohol dehydrogenase-like predicted oxidoreductase
MHSSPTHLNTATTIPLSHHGHRSQVGMWLKSHAELRGCVLVATKFGEQFDTDTGRTAVDLSAAAAERCLDASERLLGRVDVLYSHVTSQVGECTQLFLFLRCTRAHTPSRSMAFTLVVTRDRPELVWCVTSFSTKQISPTIVFLACLQISSDAARAVLQDKALTDTLMRMRDSGRVLLIGASVSHTVRHLLTLAVSCLRGSARLTSC